MTLRMDFSFRLYSLNFLILILAMAAAFVPAVAQDAMHSRKELRIDYQSGTFIQDSTPPVAPFIYVFRSQGTTYYHGTLNGDAGAPPLDEYIITPNIEPLLNSSCTDRLVKKAELQLRLDLGETYEWKEDLSADGFTLGFTFEVKAYNGTTPLGTGHTITLVLKKDEPEKLVSIDYTSLHQYSQIPALSSHVTHFTITKISYSHPGKDAIIKKARFWVGDRLEIVSKATAGSSNPLVQVQKVATITESNPVTFNWSAITPPCAFPNYQFQLLRLYNINDVEANRSDEKKVDAVIDWSKALTIETESSDPSIALTLTEGTGYYIWRVRPIGDFYEGGIANDANWGIWSDWTTETTVVDGKTMISLISPATTPNSVFFYQQFDSDKNWIYQRSFSENRHINEQMVYANGLGQVKQNQMRLPSKEAVLASQTVYDFAGRPSLTSMTAPLKQDNNNLRDVLGYQKLLLQEAKSAPEDEGVLYTSSSFDSDPYMAKPVMEGDVAAYYSDDNPDLTIPSAANFPYVRTLYYADGTSRPKEIGGMGETHRIKPAGPNRHTTRYSYATPSDDELIAIFGHEAPSASSVQKVTTWDANNIASVQYISKEGKTLATCLVNGTGNPSLIPLPKKNDVLNPNDPLEIDNEHREVVFGKTVRDTVHAGTTTGQFSHSAGKNISLGSEQVMTIHYKVFPEVLQFQCGNTEWCAIGDYEVDLRLRDVEDPTKFFTISLPPGKAHHIDIEGGPVACNTVTQPQQPVSYTVTTPLLPPGTYAVERQLRTNTLHSVNNVNEPYLDTYLNKVRQDLKAEFDATLVPIYAALSATDPDPVVEQQALKTAIDNLYAQYPNGIISAGCCELVLPPKEDCETGLCDDVERTPEGKLDFEKMLFDKWKTNQKIWTKNDQIVDPNTMYYGENVANYFFTNKTGVCSTHTIRNNGDFNTLVHNMINDGYSCEQLTGCWMALVEGFESMISVGQDIPSIERNQNFDLLESFLRCTGTMYGKNGINPMFADPSDAVVYSKVVLNAHKYFYYNPSPPTDRTNACINLIGTPPQNPTLWTRQLNGEYKWEEFYFCVTEREAHHMPLFDEQDIITQCSTQCDARFEGFINEVRRAYHAAGKVIDNDPQAATQKPDVTMNEIMCIAGRLVNRCKEDCASNNNLDVVKALGYDIAVHLPSAPGDVCNTGFVLLDAPATYTDNTLQDFVNKLNEKLTEYKANPAFQDPAYTDDWYVSYLEIAATENMGLNCCGNPFMKVKGEWTQAFTLYPPNGGSNLYLVTTQGGIPVSEEPICDLGTPCAAICFAWVKPGDVDRNSHVDPIVFRERTCEREFAQYVLTVLDQQRSNCTDEQVKHFAEQYHDKMSPDAVRDEFFIEYDVNQYHYTLYYYDRAGNLVQTVPPRGVDILENGTSTFFPDRMYDEPAHTFKTMYKHNSLAQVVEQQTPDGGTTLLVYDSKGRVRFSQSARQRGQSISYMKYDELGRVVEAGETTEIALIGNTPNSTDFDPVLARQNADQWSLVGGSYQQSPFANTRYVTRTVYSTPQTITYHTSTKEQRYLQNRVSLTVADEDGNFTTTEDQITTYYSYDPHGNVEWVVQNLPMLGSKFVRYEYDLISNKPTMIHYNEGMVDQFHHRYSYDDENRLILAETSRDGKVWDRDAAYEDYLHGAMRRTVLGEDGVQGLDYVYTIHGWLKAINHPDFGTTNTRLKDPGMDGVQNQTNENIGMDAFGMVLGYYNGDFNRTGSDFASTSPDYLSGYDLYNGNISGWHWNQEYVENGRQNNWLGETYRYDHLNRLLASASYSNSGSNWAGPSVQYSTKYRYDPNGNILKLERDGGPTGTMDDLEYTYEKDINGKVVNNRLRHVDDWMGASGLFDVDIDDQDANNYMYDGDGNLIEDKQERTTIEWNNSGKIHRIIKRNTSNVIEKTIRYYYNAQGNRVIKDVYAGTESAGRERTWYVYAADGNVLAVYKKAGSGTSMPAGGDAMGSMEQQNDAPMAMAAPVQHPENTPGEATASMIAPAQQTEHTQIHSYIASGSDTPPVANPAPGDLDGDGKMDEFDNCPSVPNFDQKDKDGDGQGDACDPDIDGDGVLNGNDLCPDDAPLPQNDINKDGCSDQQSGGSGNIQLAELYMYGRSRVGVMKPEGVYLPENANTVSHNVDVVNAEHDSVYVRRVERKSYELTDHLGNVRVVINDVKTTTEVDGDGKPGGPYTSTLLAANNYYPFGMLQPGRHWETGEYRYGYNGMEKDDEVKGLGNHISFNDYGLDTRLGRRFGNDPVFNPEISPYAVFNNNPNFFVDPDGESPISIFAKAAIKAGLKKAAKEFVEAQIKKRLKIYMGKQGARKWATQLADDAMEFIDYATATEWWEYALEVVPAIGDGYGAMQLGKQGYEVWKGLKKFEKIAELGDRAAKNAWKKLGPNTGLTGKGANELNDWIENVNKNYGEKLNDNTIAGAIKEKFGLHSGFKPDGTPYKHLNSLTDRMNGLKKQIEGLEKSISSGNFSGDALKAAQGILNDVRKQYDDISNVITSADKAVNTLGKVYP